MEGQGIKKSFFMETLFIAVPVALQCMLSSSFSIVDQLMIGRLGSGAIASVGLAGKFVSVFYVILAAVCAAASIMISQYMGQKNAQKISRSFFLNLFLSLALCAAFFFACAFFSKKIMSFYSSDQAVLEAGGAYLRVLAFSFLPSALIGIFSVLFRCASMAQLPLIATFAASAANTFLNFALIFGRFGFPKMGIRGAALASVLSQWFGLLFVAAFAFVYLKKNESFSLRFLGIKMQKGEWRDYAALLLPLLAGEFFWVFGENAYSAIYGRLGTAACAAMTLSFPIQGLFIGALGGLSQAAAVLIGRRLGEKNYEAAYSESKKIILWGFCASLVFCAVLILGRGFYARLFNVEEEVRVLAKKIIAAFAVLQIVKVQNMILGGGIVRSGGNTKLVMAIDALCTWLIGVPLGVFSAFVLKLEIHFVYFFLSLEECVRLFVTAIVFKKKSWMKTL